MGVCDKKSRSMWSIVQSYCSARSRSKASIRSGGSTVFSSGRKPAVLEAEEDESYRDANGRDPEKHICRNRRHPGECDESQEERKIEEHDREQVMGPDPFGVER